jgi:hypothetical protein
MLKIHQMLLSKLTIPIHYGTILLTREEPESILRRMKNGMVSQMISNGKIKPLLIGQTLARDVSYNQLKVKLEVSDGPRLAPERRLDFSNAVSEAQ